MTPAQRLFAIKSLALAIGVTAGSATALAQGAEPEPAPDPGAPVDPATTTDPGTAEPAPVDTVVAAPEPAPEPAKEGPPPLEVFYDKGIGFKTADDKFEAKLALRSQLRYEFERSTADGAESLSRFYLPRVRLQLEGHVFGKETRYKMEIGLSERGSFSFMKDYFVERKVSNLWLRMGQWKRPFHRQEIISDFASTFNERSITNEFVGGGRDLGFAVHNDYEKSPEGIEYVFGIFNGFSGGNDRPRTTTTCTEDPVSMEITCATGPATNFATDFSPALVARVGYNKGAVKGYSEVDLDGGPLRWGVAANYKIDLADLSEGAEESTGDNLSHAFGFDAIAKVNGIDALVSGVGQKLKSADLLFGGLAQVGYMVVPKQMHLAGRFAFHQIQGADDKELNLEGRVAFTYFFAGHALKIASDVGFLKTTGVDGATIQVRIMPQLTF